MNVCIPYTTYALLQYLLYCPEEELYSTIYFPEESVPKSVRDNLHVKWVIGKNDICSRKKILPIRLRAMTIWKYLLDHSEIYAQDHSSKSSPIIGSHYYTLLEDSSGHYSNHASYFDCCREPKSWKQKMVWKYLNGETYAHYLGTSHLCKNRLFTSVQDVKKCQAEGLPCTYVDFNKCWEEASETKKAYIEKVYGLTDADIDKCKSSDTIMLTQPIMQDFDVPEEDVIKIYCPYVEKYPSILIKPHPRDNVRYEEYFPGVRVLRTVAPMQLINLLGADIRRAITINSSAISSMPSDTEIIWLGTKVHPKVYAFFGDMSFPYKDQFAKVVYP